MHADEEFDGSLSDQDRWRMLPGGGTDFGPMRENERIPVSEAPSDPLLLTVRVELVDAAPEIWRRLELRGDLRLNQVHEYLQAAMGWSDSHLHRFYEPGAHAYQGNYFLTENDRLEGEAGTPEDEVRLDQVLTAEGDTLTYLYDFGDDWEHLLQVEKVRVAEADTPAARILEGQGACPPEDVGGIFTWNELAAALRRNPDPASLRSNHDLAMYADWLPVEGLDPDAFDRDGTTNRLSQVGLSTEEIIAHLANSSAENTHVNPLVIDLLERLPAALTPRYTALIAKSREAASPPPSPRDLAAGLRPWQALLDEARGEGIPLTSAGWISPAACVRILDGADVEVHVGKGNREQHIPELRSMRERLTSARLIRKYKGALVLTRRGRRAAEDQQALAHSLANSFVTENVDNAQREQVLLTLLLLSAGEVTIHPTRQLGPDELSLRVLEGMDALGWIRASGGPLHASDMSDARHLVRELAIDGIVERRTPMSDEVVRYFAYLALWPIESEE